jgi:peptide deformylase
VIRPILIYGDPILHQKAKSVTVFDKELEDLVRDMFETMSQAPGVGLAAPQVGVSLRLFVYNYPDDDDNPRKGVVINPSITTSLISQDPPDPELDSEGCLSVPGERFALARADQITIEGVDLEQNPVRISAEGWFARIFQHEFDHLEGIIYVDILPEQSKSEAFDVMNELGWNRPGQSWLPGTDHLED